MLNPQRTLNCRGRLLSLSRPVVMGILNVTPDSFYDGGRHRALPEALQQVERMLSEGAAVIDVGGMSTRPRAETIPVDEELRRVLPVLEEIAGSFPEAFLSIDTVHAAVAREAVAAGAHMINDVSAGRMDKELYPTVAAMGVPYVLMHMQGIPQTMYVNPRYDDVVQEILDFFIREIGRLRDLGVRDILLDPGFGFGKTLEHNYRLLKKMHVFQIPGLPLLAGLSRKSMIYRLVGATAEGALNGTTALHMVALQQGASILRAHDVREACEVIRLWEQLEKVD